MAHTAIKLPSFAANHVKLDEKLTKRIRQRRPTYLAQAISYSLDAAILYLYSFTAVTGAANSLAYLAAGIGWTSITLLLSEVGFNDRFEDHYLTVPQSLGSIGILLGAIYWIPDIGFYFVTVTFVVLGFGALRMSARQTGLVWTYAAIGLTYLFAVSGKPIAMPMATPAERNLALLCFVTALGRCAFTGLYGSSLREMLYKRGNELKEAHARIEELAQIDELTGLLNRRYIMKALSEEIARSHRTGCPCSVAIIDLDLFKRVNDGFGHPIGDEVLRTFGLAMGANVRDVDKLGRYGGEEFLVVLPGSERTSAFAAVDRLRAILAEHNWMAISHGLTVTMSAGIAQAQRDEAPDEVLARADSALYKAKETGRNRVVCA